MHEETLFVMYFNCPPQLAKITLVRAFWGRMNFVIYAYGMLLLFLPSLSLSIAQPYMLHIIDSCDDAGA